MRFILLITCMAIVVTGIAMVHSFVLKDSSAQKSYLDIKTSDVLKDDSGAEVTTAADTSKAPSVTIVISSSAASSASTHISTVPQTTTAVTTAKSTTVPQETTTATVASTTAATTAHSTISTSTYPRPPVGTMKPIDPEATYGYNAHDYLD